jgi:hypothetical protein
MGCCRGLVVNSQPIRELYHDVMEKCLELKLVKSIMSEAQEVPKLSGSLMR